MPAGTSTVSRSYDSSRRRRSAPKSSLDGRAASQPVGSVTGVRRRPELRLPGSRPLLGAVARGRSRRRRAVDQAAAQRGRRRAAAAAVPYRSPSDSRAIFSWSLRMPWSSASGRRRAAGDVDVDRDDLVDALGDGVRVPVRAAAVGAGAEGDDVLRLGHLLVEPLDRGRHLVGDRAGDDHQVGLARAGRERDDAEPDEVVAGHGRGDELDGAAGEAEVEDPEAVAAAPVEDHLHRLGREPGERAQALRLRQRTGGGRLGSRLRSRAAAGVTSMPGRPSSMRTAVRRPGSRGRRTSPPASSRRTRARRRPSPRGRGRSSRRRR